MVGGGARRMTAATLAALVCTIVFWASAFAAIRATLSAYGPAELALLRFATASVALGLYAATLRMRLPELRDIPVMFLLGFTGVSFYHVALNYGQITVPAGSASLLINTSPVFTAILASIFLRERLRTWGWAGIALSFVGVSLIAMGKKGGLRLEPGAVWIVLSALSVAVFFVVQKPYLKKYGALAVTTYAIWAGTLLLLVFTPRLLPQLRAAPWQTTAAVVYLGVFPAALAYVTWAYVLSHMPAAIAMSFTYLISPLAFLIAWVWLREVPGTLAVVGGILAIGGVVVVNRWGKA